MASKPLNILIHAMDGTGHINAAIGLGQAALKRGHKVSYLLNEAFKGSYLFVIKYKLTFTL